MTRIRLTAPALAALGLFGAAPDASAAWDNVFQVTCRDCARPSYSQYVAGYADPAPAAQPQKVEYQQRSFYEPITVMKPEKYVEPVEVRSKSFYWEPVTSYSYSSYYDPCSQQCQRIATPRTSYRLKEQCNTSMRYVERTRMVPSQSQRLVTETVPVYTMYGAPTRSYSAPAPVEDCPPGTTPPAAPRVDEFRSAPARVEAPTTNIPATQLPVSPLNSRLKTPVPAPTPRPASGFNAHTVARAADGAGLVRGEVVLSDLRTPRANARVVFVNADELSDRKYVTADAFGNFEATLPAGEWHLYLGHGDGTASYHKKVTVAAHDARDFRVVSR